MDLKPGDLPTGVLVGTAIITDCVWNDLERSYEWHLADAKRLPRKLKPRKRAQPIWFRPFG